MINWNKINHVFCERLKICGACEQYANVSRFSNVSGIQRIQSQYNSTLLWKRFISWIAVFRSRPRPLNFWSIKLPINLCKLHSWWYFRWLERPPDPRLPRRNALQRNLESWTCGKMVIDSFHWNFYTSKMNQFINCQLFSMDNALINIRPVRSKKERERERGRDRC